MITPTDSFKQSFALQQLRVAPDRVRQIIPEYKITHILGVGGNAVVYLALDSKGYNVALKVPKSTDIYETIDESIIKKFHSESGIWEKLNHSNIVQFYNSNTIPLPFIVMEYMNGGNLKDLMNRTRLTIDESVHIIQQVLRGLSYAHRMATVHRDLKPENILFARDGIAKITDWGVGKFMASAACSKTVGTKGTLHYCAPEQFNKRKYGSVDWRTDIFQVGVMFYEMLTGENPFSGEDMADCMGRVLMEIPEPPSSIDSRIPEELDQVVMGALEKEKDDRWDSGAVMLHELKRMIQEQNRKMVETRYENDKNNVEWEDKNSKSYGEREKKKCSECGSQVSLKAKYCGKCGAEIKEIEEEYKCSNCERELKKNSKFCPSCGIPVESGIQMENEDISTSLESGDTGYEIENANGEGIVTVINMRFDQNQATKIASKELALGDGFIFKPRIERISAVILKYLPLVRASMKIVEKGFFSAKKNEIAHLYFHGLNGKLLMMKDQLIFQEDSNLQDTGEFLDLNDLCTFVEMSRSMLPKKINKTRICHSEIGKKIMKMFGVPLEETKTVYLPIFKYKVTNIKSGFKRILYVDSLFGIPTENNPFT